MHKPRKANKCDALELLIENKLSKRQYEGFKKFNAKHNFNILPCYSNLLIEKKNCYPTNIQINDREARVNLQSLLEHTLQKLFNAIENDLCMRDFDENENCVCDISYGFDGSSGFSAYQQELNSNVNDRSLFVSSMSLLKISSNKNVIWLNPSPSSVRFNRPIWLIYEKENEELTKKVHESLKREIQSLQNIIITICNGTKFIISFNFSLTLIDGKILALLNNTSTQSCPNCKAKPKDMKNMTNVVNKNFIVDKESLLMGMSILHTEIQIFNSLYNTAAKKSQRILEVDKQRKLKQ